MGRFTAMHILMLKSCAGEQKADMKTTELNTKHLSLSYWTFYSRVYYTTSEFIKTVAMKFNVSWDVTPYSLVEIYRCFE
jgi:hypothetical protein